MIRTLVVLFLAGHGLVHYFMYDMPVPKDASPPPFDPHRSWLLRRARVAAPTTYSTSVWIGWLTTAMFALGAVGLAIGAGWWIGATTAAAIAGLALKLGWFNPWLSLGVALDVGILIAVTTAWPAALY